MRETRVQFIKYKLCSCTTFASLTFYLNLLNLFIFCLLWVIYSFSPFCVYVVQVSTYKKVLNRMNRFLRGFHDFLQLEMGVRRLLVGCSGSFSLTTQVLFTACFLQYDFRACWQLPLSLAQVKRVPISLAFCQRKELTWEAHRHTERQFPKQ